MGTTTVERASVGDLEELDPDGCGGQLTLNEFDVQGKDFIKGALILQRQAQESYDRGHWVSLCV